MKHNSIHTILLRKPTGGASDKKLKKNIKELDNVLSRVLALRPVTWQWKTDNDQEANQYGFIAQEVEALFPGIVTDDVWQDRPAKVMSTHDLLPYAIGAIKEQHAHIKTTEKQLHKLLEALNKQAAEIKALKEQLANTKRK